MQNLFFTDLPTLFFFELLQETFFFLGLIYLKPLYQLRLIAYCVKKGNKNFSYVLKDGLIWKYLVITP